MTKKKATRQERRIAARKKQILEAATGVFLTKGFHRATTKEIAEAADISEGTIYNYFDSKEDLLVEIISSMAALEERQTFFDDALQMNFRDFLSAFSNQRQVTLGGRYDMLVVVFSEIMSDPRIREDYNRQVVQPGIEMFVRNFQTRIERGELLPIENLPLVVRLLTGASLGLWLLMMLGDPVILEAAQDPEVLTEIGMKMLYDQFIPDAEEEHED